MIKTETTAIILAAGYSSRMGEFKPLLRLGNATVLERVISMFQEAGINDTKVVVGFRSAELLALLKKLGIQPIINDRFEEGMFSSILAGVNTIEADRKAFFLMPVDIPLVRYQTVVELMRRFQESRREILYPCFKRERGHPPLISTRLIPGIKSHHGIGGLRSFLDQHEEIADDIAVVDEAILYDMDKPADYQKILKRYERYDIPVADECMALLTDRFMIDKRLLDHCKRVANLAVILGKTLNEAGFSFDLDALFAAGLLHDVARNQQDHAEVGKRMLQEIGYVKVGDIVGEHMDISFKDDEPLNEKELLYLADKLVMGDKITDLNKRFQQKAHMCTGDAVAMEAIHTRLNNALKIRDKVEESVGKSLETILSEIMTQVPEAC
ncbi:NTP transferase domain-containing protein [bacterium]|nr:NTP transferase domain-containing protein [bacterium]